MSKSWGTPTWYFFHTLAEQVKEDDFIQLKDTLFKIFKTVCNCLPCQDCTNHANQYIKTVPFHRIQTKEDFKQLLFRFHNDVNKRTHKPQFTNYDMYKGSRLKDVYLEFKNAYLKNYTLNRGFMDTMYRKNVIQTIEGLFRANSGSFIWL